MSEASLSALSSAASASSLSLPKSVAPSSIRIRPKDSKACNYQNALRITLFVLGALSLTVGLTGHFAYGVQDELSFSLIGLGSALMCASLISWILMSVRNHNGEIHAKKVPAEQTKHAQASEVTVGADSQKNADIPDTHEAWASTVAAIKQNPMVALKQIRGATLVYYAIHQARVITTLNIVVACPKCLDVPNIHGLRPLAYAQALLESWKKEKDSPNHITFSRNLREIILIILLWNAYKDGAIDDWRPILVAVEKDPDMACVPLHNYNEKTIMHFAVETCDEDTVQAIHNLNKQALDFAPEKGTSPRALAQAMIVQPENSEYVESLQAIIDLT